MQYSFRHLVCPLLCGIFFLCKIAMLGASPLPLLADSVPQHRMVLQTGLSMQFGDFLPYRLCEFSAAWASSKSVQLGLQFGKVLYDGQPFSFDGNDILTGGGDLAFFGKFFFYNTLKQRRSRVYVGFDLRAGRRRFLHYDVSGRPEYAYQTTSWTGLGRIGWQKRFGRGVLEFAAPVGIQQVDFGSVASPLDPEGGTTNHPVAILLVSLGIRI